MLKNGFRDPGLQMVQKKAGSEETGLGSHPQDIHDTGERGGKQVCNRGRPYEVDESKQKGLRKPVVNHRRSENNTQTKYSEGGKSHTTEEMMYFGPLKIQGARIL